MTCPGDTLSPTSTGILVTVMTPNGAEAVTLIVLAAVTTPVTAMVSVSTCHPATAVSTDGAGAADCAATSRGDSTRVTAARPVADIASTPTASPPRKKRLIRSGSGPGGAGVAARLTPS